EQTIFGFEILEVESAVITHPTGVDVVIFSRRLPVNDILARSDDGVAASRATGADALGFFQKPDAHLETEIGRGQCAHRTNIDSVERIIIFKPLAGMRSQHGVTAAVDESEHIIMRDLLTETDAT